MLRFLMSVLIFAVLFFIAEAWFSPKGVCASYDRQFQKVTRCFKIGKG